MVLKRLNSRNIKEESEEVKIVNRPSGVKFYSIVDVVHTDRIMGEVKDGNLVFLNIGRIAAFPERKREFLQSLKEGSAALHATLKMVSEETVMVAPSTIPIEIRSLSPVRLNKKEMEKIENILE